MHKTPLLPCFYPIVLRISCFRQRQGKRGCELCLILLQYNLLACKLVSLVKHGKNLRPFSRRYALLFIHFIKVYDEFSVTNLGFCCEVYILIVYVIIEFL